MTRLLIVALMVLLTCGAPGLHAQENTRPGHPADWDPDTREFIGLMPFKVGVAKAALLDKRRPEDARLHLVAFFVGATDRGEEKVRAMGVQKGWDARMLGLYDTVRAEVRPLTDEPRRVYDLAWKLAREAGAGDINPYSWRQSPDLRVEVAWHLHMWSVLKDVNEANFEYAQGLFEAGEELKVAQFTCWQLAVEGFSPAIEDLASRYETGSGFAKDLKKALYWATKGMATGLPLMDQVSRLRKALSREEVSQVDSSQQPPFWR